MKTCHASWKKKDLRGAGGSVFKGALWCCDICIFEQVFVTRYLTHVKTSIYLNVLFVFMAPWIFYSSIEFWARADSDTQIPVAVGIDQKYIRRVLVYPTAPPRPAPPHAFTSYPPGF